MKKIKIGIVGYGNLGKGAETALTQNSDMELVGIFTRRHLESVAGKAPFIPLSEIKNYVGKIDVMLLCGGSATDLPEQGPYVAQWFNTIDSYDTHAKIPEYFEAMDKAGKTANTASIISVGWDPGLFSLNRLLGSCVLPEGNSNTFWGSGVSQGHSDAIRRIEGVKNAKQYTIPVQTDVDDVRNGKIVTKPGNEMHLRDCYVVAEKGADKNAIEKAIITMPNYFVGYKTTVTFIDDTEFNEKHTSIPHGGFVFRSGKTDTENTHVMEFALRLDDNPGFTSSVLVAYARALYRLVEHGGKGAYTVFDIPFGWLSPKSPVDLRKELL